MHLLKLWSNSKMLLNNRNESPHRRRVCSKKRASSPCSPASTIWVYIWSQEAPGRPQTVQLLAQTSTQQLGFLSKAYSTYLNLLGQQNGAGTAVSTVCPTCLALPASSGAADTAGIILLSWHFLLSERQEVGSVGMHDMQDERGRHLNHLKQSLQGKPGSQEPHSALCHPFMVLKSLKQIFYFLKVFLTMRRSSQNQAALQWEVWGPNNASLKHLRGASYCVQTTLLGASDTSVWGRTRSSWAVVSGRKQGWSSSTSSTLTFLCSWHSSGCGEPPRPPKAEDGEALLHPGISLCCGGLWWAGKADGACLERHRRNTSPEWAGNLTGEKWNCLWQEEAASAARSISGK